MKSTHLLHTGPIGQYSSSETVCQFWKGSKIPILLTLILAATGTSNTIPFPDVGNTAPLTAGTGHKVDFVFFLPLKHCHPMLWMKSVKKNCILIENYSTKPKEVFKIES